MGAEQGDRAERVATDPPVELGADGPSVTPSGPPTVSCPKCGHRQRGAALCRACGVDMARFVERWQPVGSADAQRGKGIGARPSDAPSGGEGTRDVTRTGAHPTAGPSRPTTPTFPAKPGAWLRLPAALARDVTAALAVLLQAGVAPCEATALLAEAAPPRARRCLLRLAERLSDGEPFSEAAAWAPELFSGDDGHALAGARGDAQTTAATLRAISGRLAARDDVRRQLVRGLGFSALVVLSCVALGPASLLLTDSVGVYAWAVARNVGWLAVGGLGAGSLLAAAARHRGMRRVADAIVWRLPGIASAWLNHRRGVFCSALGHAMAAGADVDQAVEAAAWVCGDQALQSRREAISAAAHRGSGLAGALARHGAIHRVDAIVAVAAERAEQLPVALAAVSERCALRRRSAIKIWTTTLGIALLVAGTVAGASKLMDAYRSMSLGIDASLPELDLLDVPDLQVPLPALP